MSYTTFLPNKLINTHTFILVKPSFDENITYRLINANAIKPTKRYKRK